MTEQWLPKSGMWLITFELDGEKHEVVDNKLERARELVKRLKA